MQVSGWESIGQNYWQKLKYLYGRETQSICWMNCALIQTNDVKIIEKGSIKNK